MYRGWPALLATAAMVAAGWSNGTTRSCWQLGRAPQVNGSLTAVGARSPYDVWALSNGAASHWNGASWRTYPTARGLDEVYVAPNADAWAAGFFAGHARIAAWNGRRWTRVPLGAAAYSRIPGGIRYFDAVSGRSASDIWAVGGDERLRLKALEFTQAGVVFHWDGRTWDQIRLPGNVARGIAFHDVAVTSSGIVWIAGESTDKVYTAALVLRYDGAHWERFWVHAPSSSEGVVVTSLAIAGRDIVAAGSSGVGGGGYTGESWGLVFRWNGHHWSTRVPDWHGSFATYDAVAASSPRTVWVADNDTEPLHQQDGTQLFTALHPRDRTRLDSGWIVRSLAFDGRTVWAVGGVGSGYAHPEQDYDYATFRPFVLRCSG